MSGLAAGLPVDKGGVVKHSEFWNAVEAVFGPAYGRSLAQDLVLPGLGVTCVQALDDGVARRPASGRRRAHGEQHIVRGGELA